MKPSCEVIINLDQWFRRRCRLKKKVYGRTDDGQRPITIAHLIEKNIFMSKCNLDSISVNHKIQNCRIKLFCLQ